MARSTALSTLGSLLATVFALTPSSHALAEPINTVDWDSMLTSCQGKTGDGMSFCVRNNLARFTNRGLHTIPYGSAREALFRKIDAYENADNVICVDSVYSEDTSCRGSDPKDRKPFNVEHTWPQSRLKEHPRFAESKADLFHLFPTENHINSIRGNFPFRDCNDNSSNQENRVHARCDGGFQPPAVQRGKVARAMFYMAVNYGLEIDAKQEATLRQWNKEFPVTDSERERDNQINDIQGNHNPFIAHPEWADLIKNF
jgi:deoxyribonuclease-1